MESKYPGAQDRSGPEVIKLFSANKYENANNIRHFQIYWQRNFHAQLCLARKNLALLVI